MTLSTPSSAPSSIMAVAPLMPSASNASSDGWKSRRTLPLPRVLFRDVALVQQMRHAQQHGRVRVVAAGVHHAVVGGLERHVHCFLDGQRVHVGADADGRPVAGADLRDHAGATDAGLHVGVADLGQRIGHELRGAHLLEAQFRVFVDVAAQAHHLVLQGFGLV